MVPNLLKLLVITLLGLCMALPASADDSVPVRTDHLTSRLVAYSKTIVPGRSLQLGLLLEHDPHWHTYWKNAGDSGLATSIEFTLPAGFKAGSIQWPVPQRLPLQELMNFGYDKRALLPVSIEVPAELHATGILIKARAKWLVCEEVCVPGEASYTLNLPVAATAAPDERWSKDFAWAQRRQPSAAQAISARYLIKNRMVEIELKGKTLPADLHQWIFFPATPRLIANAALPVWQRISEGWNIRIPLDEYFSKAPEKFDVLLARGDQGITLTASFDKAASVIKPASPPQATALSEAALPLPRPANSSSVTVPSKPSASFNELMLAIAFSFVGGLILNLMPCVFPILSLKALAALRHAHDHSALRRHGIVYTLGVVTSFAAIAGVLLVLRNGGERLGWGFQLQEPVFVALLALLMFAMAMSFAGLMEIGGRLGGLGQTLTEGKSLRSAFFTGVLACVVASPCTAPFMGTALGFAIAQPVAVAMTIFIALGMGMAFPMLLLGFVPRLMRLLPRPGLWMEHFRQFMVFPLLFSVIWLVWVYGEQTSVLGVAYLLASFTLLALGLWLLSHAKGHTLWHHFKYALALAAIIAGIIWPIVQTSSEKAQRSSAAHPGKADRIKETVPAEPWSAERLAQLRAEGRPVLVNMTAAWCITCLANQRAALSSSAFADQLAEKNVVYLKGDWTLRDEAISTYLESFGRTGVPLYVLYPANGAAPRVLPQLLTPAIVKEALAAL